MAKAGRAVGWLAQLVGLAGLAGGLKWGLKWAA